MAGDAKSSGDGVPAVPKAVGDALAKMKMKNKRKYEERPLPLKVVKRMVSDPRQFTEVDEHEVISFHEADDGAVVAVHCVFNQTCRLVNHGEWDVLIDDKQLCYVSTNADGDKQVVRDGSSLFKMKLFRDEHGEHYCAYSDKLELLGFSHVIVVFRNVAFAFSMIEMYSQRRVCFLNGLRECSCSKCALSPPQETNIAWDTERTKYRMAHLKIQPGPTNACSLLDVFVFEHPRSCNSMIYVSTHSTSVVHDMAGACSGSSDW